MDSEKKKAYTILFFLGGIIIVFVFIFIWGVYLNRGTVRVIGEAPFTILASEDKQVLCSSSPCEIVFKRGIKDLIISKDGYKSVSTEVKVKLWRTVDLNIEFQINPYIQKIEKMPISEEPPTYEILADAENGMFKLVKVDDDQKRAIVFFQKSILSPKIFGSEKAVLVVDQNFQEAYRVDILAKEREKLDAKDLNGIEKVVWSDDGKQLAFTKENSEYIWILDKNNKAKVLSLKKNNSSFSWSHQGNLVFITQQQVITTSENGAKANYVNLLDEISQNSYHLGEYNTLEQGYELIKTDQSLNGIPESLIPADNGRVIYFQIGTESYRLIL